MFVRVLLLGAIWSCVGGCVPLPPIPEFKAYEGAELPSADLAAIRTGRACRSGVLYNWCQFGAVARVADGDVTYYSYARDFAIFGGDEKQYEIPSVDVMLRPGTYAVTYQAACGKSLWRERTTLIDLQAGHQYAAESRIPFMCDPEHLDYMLLRDLTTGEVVAGHGRKK